MNIIIGMCVIYTVHGLCVRSFVVKQVGGAVTSLVELCFTARGSLCWGDCVRLVTLSRRQLFDISYFLSCNYICFSRVNADKNGDLIELGKTRRKRHRRKPATTEVNNSEQSTENVHTANSGD